VDAEFFEEGKMFDGSSIGGWKGINESDMVLMPDASTAVIDPFFADSNPDYPLRHPGAGHPAGLRPRSALDRQARRRVPARDRHRRYRAVWTGTRILPV
jgi:glutamine synthetase